MKDFLRIELTVDGADGKTEAPLCGAQERRERPSHPGHAIGVAMSLTGRVRFCPPNSSPVFRSRHHVVD